MALKSAVIAAGILVSSAAFAAEVKITVLYGQPKSAEEFDKYYFEKHMPMVLATLKAHGMTRYEVDRGLSGVEPGSAPAYLCIGRCYFETLEGFQSGFADHGAELAADIPNYTNAEVVLQVSETT